MDNLNNIKWRGYEDFSSYQAEDKYELIEFSLLRTKYSGLNIELFVDDGFSYIRHEHPLWVYFRNGYLKTDNVLPISIEKNPVVLLKEYQLNITPSDFQSIIWFIKENRDLLIAFSKAQLKHIDFFTKIKKATIPLNKSCSEYFATHGLHYWVEVSGRIEFYFCKTAVSNIYVPNIFASSILQIDNNDIIIRLPDDLCHYERCINKDGGNFKKVIIALKDDSAFYEAKNKIDTYCNFITDYNKDDLPSREQAIYIIENTYRAHEEDAFNELTKEWHHLLVKSVNVLKESQGGNQDTEEYVRYGEYLLSDTQVLELHSFEPKLQDS